MLNEEQQAVVNDLSGHVLVLAGPGSGKTRTIAAKIQRIIDRNVIRESQRVLAITYTNAAAAEMRERLRQQGFTAWDRLWLGTFHGFGGYLLSCYGREIGVREDFEVADREEALAFLDRARRACRHPAEAGQLVGAIEGLKKRGVLAGENDQNVAERLREVYRAYTEELRAANKLDFGDLILLPLHLLDRSAFVRRVYTRHFGYVLVDEFQDTDAQQLRLVSLFAREAVGSTVVADDDQSIYRFRGAVRENIFAFEEDMPARRRLLLRNHRSDRRIIAAAAAVIGQETDRAAKDLTPVSSRGGHLEYRQLATPREEAAFLADAVEAMLQRGTATDLGQIAVIARVKRRFEAVREELARRRIPTFERDQLKFEPSDAMAAALALLRLATEVRSGLLHARLVGTLTPLGLAEFAGVGDDLELARTLRSRVMAMKGTPSLSDWIDRTLDVSGLKRLLQQRAWSATEALKVERNLLLLRDDLLAAAEQDGLSLLNAICRISGEGAVQLLSGHAAKGQEYDHVFFIGVEEGQIPSSSVRDDAGLSEERRVFYVIMTRAKRTLVLSGVRHGGLRSVRPSRFLNDIPPELFSRRIGG